MDLKRIAEHLHIEMVEIGFVIYRNEEMGVGDRRFKHIDVEMTYGECIELVEGDMLYQEIYEKSKLAEYTDMEEVILFQLKE